MCLHRWNGVWFAVFGNAVVFFATLFAVVQRNTINGAVVGLSVTYALQVSQCLLIGFFIEQKVNIKTARYETHDFVLTLSSSIKEFNILKSKIQVIATTKSVIMTYLSTTSK